ncbi:hypothetical protein [Nocardioides nitrophenolicus]|uniref:hypothetical protein n=1 Tax=Nocardioides nitrophenolicus TaxID=60489 RepID=UPI00195F1CA7|nr:hypothetical protein [Nocardioides nitrophenolicus]MBM7519546.1 hypothetical protein [Nocardioides nitrophenolicus]
MSTEHDDLAEFEDSNLVRALRAPGTPAELADEARFVAAFASARPAAHDGVARGGRGGRAARGGRIVGRVGVGGAALLATVTLTGGMAAAAYTQHLPPSVQAIAHDAFGGVGVPPARPLTPETTAPRPTPPPSPSAPHPTESTDRRTPQQGHSPHAGSSTTQGDHGWADAESGSPTDPTAPTPTAPTSETGSPTAGSSSPTSPSTGDTAPTTGTPAPPVSATSVGATTSVRRVVTGGRATVTGLVRDDGELVEGAEVTLLQRHGSSAWTRAGTAVTGQDGTAIFATGTLLETTTYRFRVELDTDGDSEPDDVLLSRTRRIGVQPILTLSATGAIVDAHTVGAGTGDAITVSRRAPDGRLVRIGIRRLDDQGNASYDLSGYTGRVRVLVRVLRTSTHTAVKRWITVRVPREPKAPPSTPSMPSPSSSPTVDPTGTPSATTGADTSGRSTTTGS